MRNNLPGMTEPQSSRTWGLRMCVLASFALVVVLTVVATKWGIGLPFRSLLTAGLFGVLATAFPTELQLAWKDFASFVIFTALIAALGICVSIGAGAEAVETVKQIAEIHFQTTIAVLLTAIVSRICGPRQTINVYVLVMASSLVLAICQFLGVTAAWQLRNYLAFMHDLGSLPSGSGERAVALSYSKTILGTQLSLGLAAYCIAQLRFRHGRLIIPLSQIGIGAVALLIGGIVTGNRSEVLGALVFSFVLLFSGRVTLIMVISPLIFVGLLYVDQLFGSAQSTGLRVTETGDDSSQGRLALAWYGIRLFLAQPLGYGLTFEPQKHWMEHISALKGFANAEVIRRYPLHNYFLTMLNMYGIAIFAFIPMVLRYLTKYVLVTLVFTAYFVNILLHNSGPFFAENSLWFVIGAVPFLIQRLESLQNEKTV